MENVLLPLVNEQRSIDATTPFASVLPFPKPTRPVNVTSRAVNVQFMALVAAALFRKPVTDNVDDGPVAAPQETLFPSNSTERIERVAPPVILMFPWSIVAGPT